MDFESGFKTFNSTISGRKRVVEDNICCRDLLRNWRITVKLWQSVWTIWTMFLKILSNRLNKLRQTSPAVTQVKVNKISKIQLYDQWVLCISHLRFWWMYVLSWLKERYLRIREMIRIFNYVESIQIESRTMTKNP